MPNPADGGHWMKGQASTATRRGPQGSLSKQSQFGCERGHCGGAADGARKRNFEARDSRTFAARRSAIRGADTAPNDDTYMLTRRWCVSICDARILSKINALWLVVEAVASEVVSARAGPQNPENREFSRFPGLKRADCSAFNAWNQHVTSQIGCGNNREFCERNRENSGLNRAWSPSNREAGSSLRGRSTNSLASGADLEFSHSLQYVASAGASPV